jgi:leader peptidase (prepilin peptidase)/N-methyltransferase
MELAETITNLGPGWQLYFGFLVFCFGACMGSFLNVCIYRIPREESVVSPGSHCPHCNHPIAWYDNIPLWSYLVLRARCRYCKGHISPRYLIVEMLIAVLFVLVWLKLGPADSGARWLALAPVSSFWLVPIYWLAVFGLALGTFVDIEHMIIPDRVTLGGIVIGLVLSTLVPAMHFEQTFFGGLGASFIGAIVGAGMLWGVALLGKLIFKKDAMGLGDVKLLGAIGAFLGWVSVLFTVMVSSFLGALVGVSLVLMKKKEMQSRIPYGPYLAFAALIWILWGPNLWHAYIDWLIPKPLPLTI